jgi:hypothetical protein
VQAGVEVQLQKASEPDAEMLRDQFYVTYTYLYGRFWHVREA